LLLTSQYWLGLLAQGWPPLLAAVVGGLLMAPIGVLIGALTVRLGDLYVELVTLSFGLLAQTLIVTRPSFYQFGAAVGVARPEFATDERVFAYVALGFFLLVGLVIVNLRRSTTGLGVSAVRWSEPAARTLGLSVGLVWIAVLVTIGGRGGGGEGRGAPPVPRVRGWLGTVASWVHCGQGRKR
jgi:branched-chain amino acid transport system permease protein